jgi:hypothetical protein
VGIAVRCGKALDAPMARGRSHEADVIRRAMTFCPLPAPFVRKHDVLRRAILRKQGRRTSRRSSIDGTLHRSKP